MKKTKTIGDLAKLFLQNKNNLDVVDILDSDSDLFELHGYIYRKASTNNPVFHTRDLNDISAVDRKRLKLDLITTGGNAEGFDCIEIGDRSVAYESKRYDQQNQEKGLSHQVVANKNKVVELTNIDQLIFITNKRKTSFRAKKYNPKVGYIYREEIFNNDTMNLVRDYLKNKKKKQYKPMTPRDSFFEGAICEAVDDIKQEIKSRKIKTHKDLLKRIKDRIKIFQHWPASTGKGSMPRIIYDRVIQSFWDFKQEFPINVIVNPSTPVLKTNAIKHVEHDLALKNNDRHIVMTDISKSFNLQELDDYKHMMDVVSSEKHFVELFKKYHSNSTIWLHVLNDSYGKMVAFLKALKVKQIYFQHIDEVHHNIQPKDATWRAPLDNTLMKVIFCYRTSANIRSAKGKGAVESMDADDFFDIKITDLSETRAVELGYKRRARQLVYHYDLNNYPNDWKVELDDGKMPIVKFGKTILPLHWAEQLDANIRAAIEHNCQYTKYTFNRIDDIIAFEKIYQPLKEDILKSLARQGLIAPRSDLYRKILKRPFIVADTKSFNTSSIIREVEGIPNLYPDGADFGHCFLFGEGWDQSGWLDSSCFMDPTWSELRIYQDVNRGARGPKLKRYNNLIVAQHRLANEDEEYARNRMFQQVMETALKLENGFEDIRDSVLFKAVRRISKPPKGSKETGTDFETYYGEQSTDVLTGAFSDYVMYGKHYVFFESNAKVVDEYYKELETYGNFLPGTETLKKQIRKKLITKYPDCFAGYENKENQMKKLALGNSVMLSPAKKIEIYELREKIESDKNAYRKAGQKIIENCVMNQFEPNGNFTTHREKLLNTPGLDKSPSYKRFEKDINAAVGWFWPEMKIDILYKKHKSQFPKNKKKAGEAIVKFIEKKIKDKDYSENLEQLCGFEMVDKKGGTYHLTKPSVLSEYVEQSTKIKLSQSTMRTIVLCGTGGNKKNYHAQCFNKKQQKILKDFNAKTKQIQKSWGYGLLKPDEILITPTKKYKPNEIVQALKDHKVTMYSDSTLRLGRYIGQMIAKGEWKLSSGRKLQQGKKYKKPIRTTPTKKFVADGVIYDGAQDWADKTNNGKNSTKIYSLFKKFPKKYYRLQED